MIRRAFCSTCLMPTCPQRNARSPCAAGYKTSLAHVTQSSSRGLLPNRESKHAFQLVSPSVALVRRFLCWSDCRWPFLVLSKQHRRALPLSTHPSSRQSMACCPCPLCPQLVSQTPQHLRSSETQAICGGRFARHFICWAIYLFFYSGTSTK